MILRNVKMLTVLGLAVGALSLSSCAPTMSGEYADPQDSRMLDDKFNPKDQDAIIRRMMTSCLGRPWLKNFQKANTGRKPIVVVQDVQNRTDEHIDTVMITEIMETELVNSGEVKFLEKARREQVMDELEWQNSGAVSERSKKKTGNMKGADFLLVGSIANLINARGKDKDVYYQVQMKLVNIETSEIEWTDSAKILKKFTSPGAKFD